MGSYETYLKWTHKNTPHTSTPSHRKLLIDTTPLTITPSYACPIYPKRLPSDPTHKETPTPRKMLFKLDINNYNPT